MAVKKADTEEEHQGRAEEGRSRRRPLPKKGK